MHVLEPPCEHGDLWLARDGAWRCRVCDPPAFPGEIVQARERDEVLVLFRIEDVEYDARERARSWAA